MIATIFIIAGFQVYWLNKLYTDEKQGLRKEADLLFRESVYNLQLHKLKSDTTFSKIIPQGNVFLMDAMNAIKKSAGKEGERKVVISMNSTFSQSFNGEGKDSAVFINRSPEEKIMVPKKGGMGEMTRFIFRSLGDSVSPGQIDSAYGKALARAKINVGFIIVSKIMKGNPRRIIDSVDETKMHTGFVPVGFTNPVVYQAQLGNATGYLFGRITYPILVSLLLIALTTASFIFLYRNLLAQRRLTEIKNDFISNITHELKTPIATVNVAIEAMKSFNAMENPERTKEYLDISSSELQRLSLLVDKVLKLSLFENKEIELKKEQFDLKQVAEEVIKTMQLQLQKKKATLNFNAEGDHFSMEGDKLHITSVIYNLIDNALKYSPDQPEIGIMISENRNTLELKVADNGIGIPAEYHDKIFDKFFRVPHGNTHNIKGYGLGLSYVHHVIKKHGGSIDITSEEGKGSTFTINLLKEL
jgi:two-component system, OmpR family, phosphate regulon sensor histidine kinase PhoR